MADMKLLVQIFFTFTGEVKHQLLVKLDQIHRKWHDIRHLHLDALSIDTRAKVELYKPKRKISDSWLVTLAMNEYNLFIIAQPLSTNKVYMAAGNYRIGLGHPLLAK